MSADPNDEGAGRPGHWHRSPVIHFPSSEERAARRRRARWNRPPSLSAESPGYARGVGTAPYLVDGCEALIAVTSNGERVAEMVLRRGVDPKATVAALDAYLSAVDPPPSARAA